MNDIHNKTKRYWRLNKLVIMLMLVIFCAEFAAGCSPASSNTQELNTKTVQEADNSTIAVVGTEPTLSGQATSMPTKTATITAVPIAEPTRTPTSIPEPEKVGPDDFPAGVNPLTGLPVKHPENLDIPPILVSISNYPKVARPQAGLSFSPLVFEIYIGVGVSRFLTVFYGDYPDISADAEVGPIRSGRIPYESLRLLYRGSLVFASASSLVYPYLDEYTVVYGKDNTNLISARMPVSDLKEIAVESKSRVGNPGLTGLLFDPVPPQGGSPAESIWIAYHYTDQIFWRYDTSEQGYSRYQETDEVSQFNQFTDSLTGEPLIFENIVFMFADYHFYMETLFDIDLKYISRMPALAFRDGKMYEIYWTTGNQEYEKKTGKLRPVRFMDAEGNPFPLKNGQTWAVIVPRDTPYHETIDSLNYFDLRTKQEKGTGIWAIQFYAPVILDQPLE